MTKRMEKEAVRIEKETILMEKWTIRIGKETVFRLLKNLVKNYFLKGLYLLGKKGTACQD